MKWSMTCPFTRVAELDPKLFFCQVWARAGSQSHSQEPETKYFIVRSELEPEPDLLLWLWPWPKMMNTKNLLLKKISSQQKGYFFVRLELEPWSHRSTHFFLWVKFYNYKVFRMHHFRSELGPEVWHSGSGKIHRSLTDDIFLN